MDKKFTILDFQKKKAAGEKITMLTAYDYPMASAIEKAGVDAILVGDSLGMVVLGLDSTVGVTMDDMIHHTKAVSRAVKNTFLIGDMPFKSAEVSDEDAVKNAGRFVKEAKCDAVKVEGGEEILPRVKAIIAAGIPVLGHVGLLPQKVCCPGGYRVQGKDAVSAAKILNDAAELEKAGCFAIVVECVPKELAKKITAHLKIPVIGIGAGPFCDGQVLVTHDMIGFFDRFTPKFVKKYADVNNQIIAAVKAFREEAESGQFPGDEHSF